jgi:protease-4
LTAALAAAPMAVPATVPSAYGLLDFTATSPGAHSDAVGPVINPAYSRTIPWSELRFDWTDRPDSTRSWGFFMATEGFDFAVVRRHMGTPDRKLSLYHLGFSGGDRNTAWGLGFGWWRGSGGVTSPAGFWQVGLAHRFSRYLSVGVAGAFESRGDTTVTFGDLAVRPWGTPRVTLFADAEWRTGVDRLDDLPWSAGTRVEVVDGIAFLLRYYADPAEADRWTFGVSVSLGTLGGSAQRRFQDEGRREVNVYGVRLTSHAEPSVVWRSLQRDRYVKFDLTGPIAYRGYRWFSGKRHRFLSLVRDLEAARTDPRVRGVLVDLSGTRVGWERAWEIRQKLLEIRESGKRVVVFVDNADMTLYHLASAADYIVMDPIGMLVLPGYSFGRTYYRNALRKFGVGFDEWRFFTYKSALESFSRDRMSPADSVQWLEWIRDRYELVRRDVCRSRRLSPEAFDRIVNERVAIPPDSAMALGLVDTVGRWEALEKLVERIDGRKPRTLSPARLAAKRVRSDRWGELPRIAVVYGLGVCAMDEGIRARQLRKIFEKLEKDDRVAAVVFRVDSPGGDALASDVVAGAIRRCRRRKPVVVSQGEVAGSGGYWISMEADTIVAGPNTITGSIGVIGGWFWDAGFGEKTGLTSDEVHVGDHADLGRGIRVPPLGVELPRRNLTPWEREQVRKLFLDFYGVFVRKVADSRGLEETHVREIAEGRIWSGVDGKREGLVDLVGGIDLAIRVAKVKAGLRPDEPVEIREYPREPLLNLAMLRPKGLPFGLAGLGGGREPEGLAWTYFRTLSRAPGRPMAMVPLELLPEDPSLRFE